MRPGLIEPCLGYTGWLAALVLSLVQGCASMRSDDALIVPGGANTVPPAAQVAPVRAAPVGEETIGRYGGDVPLAMSPGTVQPVIRLMPVAPPYAPGVVPGGRPGYAAYPPPPTSRGGPAYEPYEDAVGRALAAGVLGGILGAQVGNGGGSHVAAGIGAATGALIGLGASDNPCATPHGGTLAGAALGGVLGHQVGSGSGRSAATALGAMLGALAGTRAGASAPECR